MTIQQFHYYSSQRISCAGCTPAEIIICLETEKVAPRTCDTDPVSDQPFPYSFINATLISVVKCTANCSSGSYLYTITYDDTQIVDAALLVQEDVLGMFCEGCLTSWVTDLVGNEIQLTDNEDGTFTLLTQHGCSYTYEGGIVNLVGLDTESVDMTVDSGGYPTVNVSADVNISEDADNLIEVREDGLYAAVPSDNLLFVGMQAPTFAAAAPTGWLLMNGGTIGNAASGATLRADADQADLFTHLWNSLLDAQAPVSTGRGANAAADFAANKTIVVPDMRGSFPFVKAAAGTGSVMGGTFGTIDHTHTGPSHTHTVASHTHTVPAHYHGMGTGADLALGTTSDAEAAHTHQLVSDETVVSAVLGTTNFIAMARNASSDFSYGMDNGASVITPTKGRSSAGSSHNHTVTANVGNFSGRVGLVTGGVNGNASMTSGGTGLTTDAGGTAATGLNNPPGLAVNWVIKY